jgi:hypothetical protein
MNCHVMGKCQGRSKEAEEAVLRPEHMEIEADLGEVDVQPQNLRFLLSHSFFHDGPLSFGP